MVAATINESLYDLEYTDRDKDPSYDAESATTIKLANATASVDGDGVTVDGSTVTITADGVYVISGTLEDGQIVVDAPEDAKVQLVLDGAHVTNQSGAALYAKQADKCFVTLASGSSNSLAGEAISDSTEGEMPDAVLYAICDLTLQGSGSLSVKASSGDAVKTKDDLVITGGTYDIQAKGDGFVGKDSVRIADGSFAVKTTEGDGIKSSKDDDESKGYVSIDGGTLEIEAADKGIQAETYLRVCDGAVLNVKAADDALHSNGSARVDGGTITLESGDDGLHAEYTLDVNGGTLDIVKCVEGLEGQVINMNDGAVTIVASDDAVNASSPEQSSGSKATTAREKSSGSESATSSEKSAGSSSASRPEKNTESSAAANPDESLGSATADSPEESSGSKPKARPEKHSKGKAPRANEGEMPTEGSADSAGSKAADASGRGFPGGFGGMEKTDENCSVNINGGTLTIEAEGDGLDSNGYVNLNGGEVYISGPTNAGNGSLDVVLGAKVTGGTLLAAGAAGMAESFAEGTQGFALVNVSGSAGDEVVVSSSDGNELARFTPTKDFQCIVVTAAGMQDGATYTVSVNGTTTEFQATLKGSVNQGGGNREQGTFPEEGMSGKGHGEFGGAHGPRGGAQDASSMPSDATQA